MKVFYLVAAFSFSAMLVQGCKTTTPSANADLASTPAALGTAITTQQLRDNERWIESTLPHKRYEVVLENTSGNIFIAPGSSSAADCLALKKAKAANESPSAGIQKTYANMLGFEYCEANPIVSALSCKRALSCTHPIVEKGNFRYVTIVQEGPGADRGDFYCGDKFNQIKTIDGRHHELTEGGQPVYTFTGKKGDKVTHSGCRFITALK